MLEASLCVDGARRHGSRQSGWHHDGDNVQGSDHQLHPGSLEPEVQAGMNQCVKMQLNTSYCCKLMRKAICRAVSSLRLTDLVSFRELLVN